MRSCIVTRERHERDSMLRFVVGPLAEVVVDIRANLPGRGVWIVAEKQKIQEAVDKNLFQRGFKSKVKVDAGLATDVEMLLEKAALGSLGFARKASQCVTGATKVTAAINSGRVIALLHASDASNEGMKKISKTTRQGGDGNGSRSEICIIRDFTSGQLNLALGGTNVIHAALLKGGAAQSFVKKTSDLRKYRGDGPIDECENVQPPLE